MTTIHLHGHITGTGVKTYQQGLTDELKRRGYEINLTHPVKWERTIGGRRVGGYTSMHLTSYYKRPRGDLMHCISNYVLARDCNSVMIHDLNPLVLKGWEATRKRFERQKALLREKCIITPTDAIRQSVATWLSVEPDRITTAHHGWEWGGCPKLEEQLPYVIYVGDYRDYKCVQEGISWAAKQGLAFMRLGPPADDAYGHETVTFGRLKLGGNFQDMGYAPKEGLRAMLARASFLWWGSSWEGFGLPLIEAASLGIPAVMKDTPVNREIMGDWGVYIGEEVGTWSRADRASLQNYARKFTWQRSVEAHVKAWKSWGLIA